VTEAEHATVAMAVDQAKLRIRILEPNTFTLPHHHLKAHALVVRQLVGRDVLAEDSDELVKRFERLRRFIPRHQWESTH
jgi:hypothetical protein